MPDVIIMHASSVNEGGVVNAALFYGLALQHLGYSVEVWSASKGLREKAVAHDIPVFINRSLSNATAALVNPAIVAHACSVRSGLHAVVHQGSKLRQFGGLWLGSAPQYVVFHNTKIGSRAKFPNWLVLSERHDRELKQWATSVGHVKSIQRIVNGPLPSASGLRCCSPSTGPFMIGALGNFTAKKGMEILVRAFAAVLQKKIDARLILGGDGPEKHRCEVLARELGCGAFIAWLGWLSDTRHFYSEIEVFCLPSRSEPFGIALVEAMQAGLPVVATTTAGPCDIIAPGETGWLVAPDDPQALAGALLAAASDRARLQTLGKAGYERFRRRYSLESAGTLLAKSLDLPQPRSSQPVTRPLDALLTCC